MSSYFMAMASDHFITLFKSHFSSLKNQLSQNLSGNKLQATRLKLCWGTYTLGVEAGES